MSTNRQRLFNDLATGATLLGRVVRWYGYYLFALFDSFVVQKQQELIPSGIIDGFVQSAFGRCAIWQKRSIFSCDWFRSAGHAFDVQVFMHHCVRFLQKGIRQFVQKVASLTTDLVMTFLYRLQQLIPFWRTFFRCRKAPLQTGQFVKRLAQIPRRSNMETVRVIQEIIQSKSIPIECCKPCLGSMSSGSMTEKQANHLQPSLDIVRVLIFAVSGISRW